MRSHLFLANQPPLGQPAELVIAEEELRCSVQLEYSPSALQQDPYNCKGRWLTC